MELADWKRKVAAEPLTSYQRGAIMREFERLRINDRGERLAICAELLGLDGLDSTGDLVMGDAGRLVAMLRQVRNRRELPDVLAALDDDQGDALDDDALDDDDQGDELGGPQPDAGLPVGDMLVRLLLMVASRAAARSAYVPPSPATTPARTRVIPSPR